MAMYWHYTVVSSKITIRCASSQNLPMYIGVAVRADATTLSSWSTDQLLEQPGIQLKLLSYQNAQSTRKVTKTYSVKKFSHITSPLSNPDCRGDASNNPVEQTYYHVIIAPAQVSDDLGTQGFAVTIDYNVVFTEPKVLSTS